MSLPVYDALKRQIEVTGKVSEYVFCNLLGQPLDNKNFSDRIWYPLLRHLDLEKRRPYDNALAETINGLYKTELIHPRAPWKTKESLELATLDWVSWFNHHRLLAPIGYIPPAEAEANYYRRLAENSEIPVSL